MIDPTEIILLVIEIQVFTASGALAPGPLSMATFGAGLKNGWKAGVYSATGHLIAEIPIFFLVAIGLLSLESIANIRVPLLIVASIFLLYLGYMHLSIKDFSIEAHEESRHPLLIGIVFTLFNPYFIIWWVTIGSIFIFDGIEILGFYGLPFIYFSHVWMDYAFLTFLSYLAGLGIRRLRTGFLKALNIVLGAILILFGIFFIQDILFTFFIS